MASAMAASEPILNAGIAASNLVSTASVKEINAIPTTYQFRKGDEKGNFEFGYDNPNSARSESGNANGGVTGSYTNKATGVIITYIADALGYRVIGVTNGRKKRSTIPAITIPATRPATKYEIKYNPGFATGYFVI